MRIKRKGAEPDAIQVRRLTKVGVIATLCVSTTATVLWIAATTYFKLWDAEKTTTYFDLWSWTCTHKTSFKENGFDMAPLCLEMVSLPQSLSALSGFSHSYV